MKILALIPARSVSKSVKNKNIASIHGKPLLAYSIEHALQCTEISRVIVSTDSSYYTEIAKQFGAEVPFLRPESISGDFSTDLETFHHTLKWLKDNEGYVPDICVHLRPTYPVRRIDDISKMIDLLVKDDGADSIRSVTKSKETPYKMWFHHQSGELAPIMNDINYREAYNRPRQALPEVFIQNAAIDVIKTSTILQKNSMTGDKILGYKMDEMFDIDYVDELLAVSDVMSANKDINTDKKTYCFDIDGVVAQLSPNNDYAMAQPNQDLIDKVNQLYDHGHKIILFTARGSKTGIDW
ncbi:MAG: acylneuraminate cytidylyltransferase family protein, partial [Cyclobacteriaceae bacterium]